MSTDDIIAEVERLDVEASATLAHTGIWSPRSIEAAARRAVIEHEEALDILSR